MIGILAPAASVQAGRLRRALAGLVPAGPPPWFGSLDLTGDAVTLDAAGVVWNGVRLETFDALHVHGFEYQDPVLPPAAVMADWSLWQAGHVIAQQSHSFLYSLLARLEAVGGRLYNPVSGLLGAFDRFGQLDRLGLAGVRVPPLCLTNDPAVATRFMGGPARVVWRPATGSGPWQLFTERQCQHLVGRDRPPVLLAHVVPGPLLRAYVVDGTVVLVLSTVAPHRGEVEEFETFGAVPPDSVPGIADVAAVPTALGLRWAMVSFVAAVDGVVIYDVDPDPVLTDLPDQFADHCLGALAAALCGQALPEPLRTGRAARPVLLLRRMLVVQFEMEGTKYPPAAGSGPEERAV